MLDIVLGAAATAVNKAVSTLLKLTFHRRLCSERPFWDKCWVRSPPKIMPPPTSLKEKKWEHRKGGDLIPDQTAATTLLRELHTHSPRRIPEKLLEQKRVSFPCAIYKPLRGLPSKDQTNEV